MKLQVGQWENYLAFRIPKYIVEELALKVNDIIEYRLEDGKLILEPVWNWSDLRLEELLAGAIEQGEEVDRRKAEREEVRSKTMYLNYSQRISLDIQSKTYLKMSRLEVETKKVW